METPSAGFPGTGGSAVLLSPGGAPETCVFAGGHGQNNWTNEYQGINLDAAENLLLRSEEFDVAPWSLTRTSIVADSIVAPDGATTADTIHEDATAASTHYTAQNFTVDNLTQYEFRVWARPDNRDWVRLQVIGLAAGNPRCDFNVTTGATGTNANTDSISISTSTTAGFYDVRIVFTTGAADAGALPFFVMVMDADNSTSFNGLDQDSLYLWGAQVRRAALTPDAYIVTEGTDVNGGNRSVWQHTRASVGTLRNADGVLETAAVDELRNEPTGGLMCGNRFYYSEDMPTGYSEFRSTWPADQTEGDPLGGTRASIWHEDATAASSHFYFTTGDNFRCVQDLQYTLSCYFKPINRSHVEFQFNDATAGNVDFRVVFDLGAVTATTTFGSPDATGLEDAGDGWYRVWMTFTRADNASGTNQQILVLMRDATSSTFNGLDQDSLYVFGMQLDRGCADGAGGPALYDSHNVADHDNLRNNLGISGWLFEEDKDNICLQSQTFGHATWTKAQATIDDNSTQAADLTTTADTLVEDNTNAVHGVTQSITLVLSSTYTMSCFVKEGTEDEVLFIAALNGGQASAEFDLATGIATLVGTKGDQYAGIDDFCNGWKRCWLSYTTDATDGGARIHQIYSMQAGSSTYLGTVADALYLWGAQVELKYMTSYVATVAASVARTRDNAAVAGEVFNPETFRLYIEAEMLIPNFGASTVIQLARSIPDVSNAISIGAGFGFEQCRVVDGTAAANDWNFATQPVPGVEARPVVGIEMTFKGGTALIAQAREYGEEWKVPAAIVIVGNMLMDDVPADLAIGDNVLPSSFRIRVLEIYSA